MKQFLLALLLLVGCASNVRAAETPSTLSIADAIISEGNSGFRELLFPISLSRALTFDVSASFVTKPITAQANSDYLSQSAGQIVLKAGQTRANILIRVTSDTVEEKDESFLVQLGAPKRCAISDSDGIGNIKDDDYAGQISIGDASVSEGNSGQTLAKALVRFSKPALHDIAVRFEVKDGTAKGGSDYLKSQGTLLFKPGRVVLDVVVPVVGDGGVEGNENCFADILVTGLPLLKSRGVVTILNDDATPLPAGTKFSVTDVSLPEGNNESGQIAEFRVSLAQPASTDIEVSYATQNGTALAGEDFGAISGQLRLRAGQTTTLLQVPILGDSIEEKDQSFVLRLSRFGGVPGDSSAVGTIEDDDYAGEIHIQDTTGYDGRFGSEARFYITAWPPPLHPVEVDYATQDGTARASSDYLARSGKFTFTSATVNSSIEVVIPLVTDTVAEDDETFFLQLSGSNLRFDRYSPNGIGKATIDNDDVTAPPPPPTGLHLQGKIVFTSAREGKEDIWVMNADGTSQTRLLSSLSLRGTSPVVSPDGKQIAFSGPQGVHLVGADGLTPTSIPNTQPRDYPTAYSPDGQVIAFVSARSGMTQIWLVNADGSGLTQLTKGTFGSFGASFSPDGSKIVFAGSRPSETGTSGTDIFTINADGTDEVRLIDDIHHDTQPRFSPDGQKIVYSSFRKADAVRNPVAHSEIWSMKADGTGQACLSAIGDYSPSYSPDGLSIAFVSTKTMGGEGKQEIYVMNADGANAQRLTNLGTNASPFWAPYSGLVFPPRSSIGKIAFVGNNNLGAQIYVMNPDGTRLTRLTGPYGTYSSPSFSRDGEKIVYLSEDAFSTDPNALPVKNIWVMNADGTNQIRLTGVTRRDKENAHPRFSPDGTKIVFTSNRGNAQSVLDSSQDIYLMNADGSNPVRLTFAAGSDSMPAFTPDGQKIIFTTTSTESVSGDYPEQVWQMNLDGTGRTRVAKEAEGGDGHYFSRDGGKIVFVSSRDNPSNPYLQQIYGMNADGTAQTKLTSGGNSSLFPCYSPDGGKIAFARRGDSFSQVITQLWLMNADGTNPAAFSDLGLNVSGVTWGPGSVGGPVMAPRPNSQTLESEKPSAGNS